LYVHNKLMSVTFGFGHIFDRNIIKPHLWVFSRTPNRRSRTCESGFLILSTQPHPGTSPVFDYIYIFFCPLLSVSSFLLFPLLRVFFFFFDLSLLLFFSLFLFYCYNRCGSLVTFFFSHHWQCQNARRKVSFVCVCVCVSRLSFPRSHSFLLLFSFFPSSLTCL
jgi:hypothetical protein